MFVHPQLSTVTYLNSCGAPTIVIPSRISLSGDIEAGKIDSAYVSWPHTGKHFVFDGQLLHAALHELSSDEEATAPRITFLVNIWLGHRPGKCRPLPPVHLARMSNLLLPAESFVQEELKIVRIDSECGVATEEASFDVDQSTLLHALTIQIPKPTQEMGRTEKWEFGRGSEITLGPKYSKRSKCI